MTKRISWTYKHAQIQWHKTEIQWDENMAFFYPWYKKNKQGANLLFFIKLLWKHADLKLAGLWSLTSTFASTTISQRTFSLHSITKKKFPNPPSLQAILHISEVNNVKKQESEELLAIIIRLTLFRYLHCQSSFILPCTWLRGN